MHGGTKPLLFNLFKPIKSVDPKNKKFTLREEDPEHYYPPFKYSGKSKAEAMKDLADAIAAYPPGELCSWGQALGFRL